MATDKLIPVKGKEFLEAGYVFAPYIPVKITPSFKNDFTLPVIRKPIFESPVKKILHEMGYDVEPDRWEEPKFQPFASSELVSVQPMTTPSGEIFRMEYTVKPINPANYIKVDFTITPDGAIFDAEKRD